MIVTHKPSESFIFWDIFLNTFRIGVVLFFQKLQQWPPFHYGDSFSTLLKSLPKYTSRKCNFNVIWKFILSKNSLFLSASITFKKHGFLETWSCNIMHLDLDIRKYIQIGWEVIKKLNIGKFFKGFIFDTVKQTPPNFYNFSHYIYFCKLLLFWIK